MASSRPSNISHLVQLALLLTLTIIPSSYGCPRGCVCRGRPEMRNTAVCFRPWRNRNRVTFRDPTRTLEFRNLSYQDIAPYLAGATQATSVTIYPPTRLRNNAVPRTLFSNVRNLQSLTIHPGSDRFVPRGLAVALEPLSRLRSIDFVGSMLKCDCTLPAVLSRHDIFLIGSTRMPAVRGCRSSNGFRSSIYRVDAFLAECARQGRYQLRLGEEAQVGYGGAGVAQRTFGNTRDRNLFNAGVSYRRINSNQAAPTLAGAAPAAFSGSLQNGNYQSGNQITSNALLQGYLPTNRRTPSVSLSHLFNRARSRSGRRRKRQVLPADTPENDLGGELDDDDFNTADLLAEEINDLENRATNGGDADIGGTGRAGVERVRSADNVTNELNLVAEAMPQAIPRSMPVENTIGTNSIGSPAVRTAMPVPNAFGPTSIGSPAVRTTAVNQHATNQAVPATGQQTRIALQNELASGSPLKTVRRRHRNRLTPRQLQLALYRLPTNDLTIRLNPFDPFEVDLFFQYILHEENLRGG